MIDPERECIENINLYSPDVELIDEIKRILDCESIYMLAIFPNISDVVFFAGEGLLKSNKAFQLLDLPKVFGKAIICGYDSKRQTAANYHTTIKSLRPLISFYSKEQSDYLREQEIIIGSNTAFGSN